MKPVFKLSSIIILFFSLLSCEYQNEEELFAETDLLSTDTTTYELHVEPILNDNCSSCHYGENINISGSGIDLENYQNVKFYADNDYLLGVIRHETGFEQMPYGGQKLSDNLILVIEKWIEDGTLEN